MPFFNQFYFNPGKSLAERVLSNFLVKKEINQDDILTNAVSLEREYSAAEAIGLKQVSLNNIDMVVVLSGRSRFDGTYIENPKHKYNLCPKEFDPGDTLRRMSYGIKIAKKCSKENLSNGINKPIFIYFNGVKEQNEELRAILKKGSLGGYPANLFIIDDIPMDNTLGQIIGLSKYLELHWPLYCHQFSLSRAPNLVICSSSYHVPRITLGVGSNSPLLTVKFWLTHPELVKQLNPAMKNYVFNQGDTLKKASIFVLGCDRKISAHPFWKKDLFCDMEARINYATPHQVNHFNPQPLPSLASHVAENIVTLFHANLKSSLGRELSALRMFSPKPKQKTSDFDGHGARKGPDTHEGGQALLFAPP